MKVMDELRSRYKYKYISFERLQSKGKTSVWGCKSNSSGDILGLVKWYGAWRQYCFFPSPVTVFNTACLTDIQDFIKQLMDERKESKKNDALSNKTSKATNG